jgi:hypothetical protein
MVDIPDSINGLSLTFSPTADRDVRQALIEALEDVLRPYAYGRLRSTGEFAVVDDESLLEQSGRFVVTSFHVSGAGEQSGHSSTSRHYMKKAVDISRINGDKIEEPFVRDPAVNAVVTAMQERFDAFTPGRRENFGPAMLRKLGVELTPENRDGYDLLAAKHKNHMHFSVN